MKSPALHASSAFQANVICYQIQSKPQIFLMCNHIYGSKAVVHNVRPAGHIRPATSPQVARGVQQENGLFTSKHLVYSGAVSISRNSTRHQLTSFFKLISPSSL